MAVQNDLDLYQSAAAGLAVRLKGILQEIGQLSAYWTYLKLRDDLAAKVVSAKAPHSDADLFAFAEMCMVLSGTSQVQTSTGRSFAEVTERLATTPITR